MPTAPRSTPGAVRTPSSQDMDKVKIEAVIVDPKEQEKHFKSVISSEQAPTVAQQGPDTEQWQQFGTQLGPPFDSERVTLCQMRQIRKDAMIAFGLHYVKVPLVRAEWHIEARDKNGPNPQVAAFVDSSLRQIYARLILQRNCAATSASRRSSSASSSRTPVACVATLRRTTGEGAQAIWDEG